MKANYLFIYLSDLEKVVNRSQVENSELYNILKIVWLVTKYEQDFTSGYLIYDKMSGSAATSFF